MDGTYTSIIKEKIKHQTTLKINNLESQLGEENFAFIWLEKDLCQIFVKAQTQHPVLVVWN